MNFLRRLRQKAGEDGLTDRSATLTPNAVVYGSATNAHNIQLTPSVQPISINVCEYCVDRRPVGHCNRIHSQWWGWYI